MLATKDLILKDFTLNNHYTNSVSEEIDSIIDFITYNEYDLNALIIVDFETLNIFNLLKPGIETLIDGVSIYILTKILIEISISNLHNQYLKDDLNTLIDVIRGELEEVFDGNTNLINQILEFINFDYMIYLDNYVDNNYFPDSYKTFYFWEKPIENYDIRDFKAVLVTI